MGKLQEQAKQMFQNYFHEKSTKIIREKQPNQKTTGTVNSKNSTVRQKIWREQARKFGVNKQTAESKLQSLVKNTN